MVGPLWVRIISVGAFASSGIVRFAISPPLEIVQCLREMILVLISLAGITLPVSFP